MSKAMHAKPFRLTGPYTSRQAILSGEPISRIFPQYGFKDYTSFFRAFKKEYGISPKEYREQHRLIRTEP